MRQPRIRLVQHVLLRQFDGVLGRSPLLLLAVGAVRPVPFREGLASWMKHTYGAELQLATLDRREVPDDAWWRARFRTGLGPVGGVRDGYYLFQDALVIGFHPHLPHLLDHGSAVAQLVGYFRDRIALARIEVEPFVDDAPPPYEPPPPGSRPQARPRIDAYAVLEVARTASDAEVRAAYRTAIKLNHPDKVAHLSRAIQDFALQQTVRIQQAWALVTEERGW